MSIDSFAIYSSHVFTGLPDRPWVEAVGVKDGLIAAIGTNREVRDALPGAEAIELPGRLVAPGMVDAHCHFVLYSRWKKMVDLRNLPSLEACRTRIREAAAGLKLGEWLLGRGWNHNKWAEGREPDKNDLDDLVPDNPSMMVRACGHSQWLNSKALQVVGITAESADPPGGKFDRDASGQPTGLIREAQSLVAEHIPDPNLEQDKAAVMDAQEELLKLGLTGVHTCESLAEWKVLNALESEGRLKLRVHNMVRDHDLDEIAQRGLGPGRGTDRLWLGHVKLFADGSLGACTALLHAPYCDENDNCGLPFYDLDKLKESVSAAYRQGFSVAIHAIGDKAGTNAIDAIAYARKDHPGPWRDSIEHVQLYHPEDLARYKSMDLTASVQPVFVPTDWSVADRLWGEERLPYAYSWKTFLDNGIRVQFGSDAPVEPIDPVLGLQAAVLRQTTDLKPENGWRPEERLTLEESLAGFTQTAAWSAGKEKHSGNLAVGNWADLTVFEKNLTDTPPEEWSGVGVEMTVIGGEMVHRKK